MSNSDPPVILYEAVRLTDDGDAVVYQAGAFTTEAEAQKVLDIWRAEGRTEPMAINLVTLYRNVEEWQANR